MGMSENEIARPFSSSPVMKKWVKRAVCGQGVSGQFRMGNQKGVALLVTLTLVAVLLVASLELVKRAGSSAFLNRRSADALQAEAIALSGIEAAKLILVRDAMLGDTDSVQELWADSDQIRMALSLIGISPDHLDLKISDELGKIQVNALLQFFPGHDRNEDQVLLWERFLDLIFSKDKSEDLRDPAEIIDSLIDWLDSEDDDAVTGLSGGESDYYENLTPPVACANGPIYRIDSFYMIKGVSHGLISNGLISSTDKDDPMGKRLSGDSDPFPDGVGNSVHDDRNGAPSATDLLDSVVTVYGMEREKQEPGQYSWPGRININTADEAVLAALLPVGMASQAAELAAFRNKKSEKGGIFSNSLDREWYKQVIELSDEDRVSFDRLIRYDTFLFRVEATATFNDEHCSITAILKREKDADGAWHCNTLQLLEP